MPLKLYNTLTNKKEVFKSIKKNKVGMYVCGPTVYDYVHIGNLRAYTFSDILRRYLKYLGYNMKEVMNITDVDDKTIKKSQKQKISLKDFTKEYEKYFLEDMNAMNIETPEVMPRATEHIKEMVAIIKELLKKKVAYKTKEGIYFSISKFNDYGKLSKIKIEELKSGASDRILKDEYEKKTVNDFALWKFWDKEDGDVFWDAEIGKGRPGWHIECSAMSMKYLGKQFDIHTGGVDLIFPHHENEIAQSEAFSGKSPFVKCWIHNEWVLVDGKKMSKSLGNFYKLKDITKEKYSPFDLKYFFLTKIYRQQLNFSWENLEAARNSRQRLKNIIEEIKDNAKINKKYLNEFEKSMNDDLNTPNALQVLWGLIRDEKAAGKYKTIQKMNKVLGLDFFEKKEIEIPEEILNLLKEREDARAKKDWKRSDILREALKNKGYLIDDTSEGPRLRLAEKYS